MSDINKAMDQVADLNEKHGIPVQGGKKYTQVVHRVEVFRRNFGLEYGIDTQISQLEGGILCKAYVMKGQDVIGTGHAFSSGLSGKKNLEKLETTAIGRAMACLGLSGGEYASDTEMETWEERYQEKQTIANGIAPVQKLADKNLNEWWKTKLSGIKTYATYKNATIERLDDQWNKLQYSEEFEALTEDQQGVLNNQYDSTRLQIQNRSAA